jgi:hypothetical protein
LNSSEICPAAPCNLRRPWRFPVLKKSCSSGFAEVLIWIGRCPSLLPCLVGKSPCCRIRTAGSGFPAAFGHRPGVWWRCSHIPGLCSHPVWSRYSRIRLTVAP